MRRRLWNIIVLILLLLISLLSSLNFFELKTIQKTGETKSVPVVPVVHSPDYLDYITTINSKVTIEDSRLIIAAAKTYSSVAGFTIEEMLSVAAVESHFNRTARSEGGDVGLYQINRGTYYNFCRNLKRFPCEEKRLLEVEYNTFVASEVFKQYRMEVASRWPEVKDDKRVIDILLIATYNSGRDVVPSTREYINRVIKQRKKIADETGVQ